MVYFSIETVFGVHLSYFEVKIYVDILLLAKESDLYKENLSFKNFVDRHLLEFQKFVNETEISVQKVLEQEI